MITLSSKRYNSCSKTKTKSTANSVGARDFRERGMLYVGSRKRRQGTRQVISVQDERAGRNRSRDNSQIEVHICLHRVMV